MALRAFFLGQKAVPRGRVRAVQKDNQKPTWRAFARRLRAHCNSTGVEADRQFVLERRSTSPERTPSVRLAQGGGSAAHASGGDGAGKAQGADLRSLGHSRSSSESKGRSPGAGSRHCSGARVTATGAVGAVPRAVARSSDPRRARAGHCAPRRATPRAVRERAERAMRGRPRRSSEMHGATHDQRTKRWPTATCLFAHGLVATPKAEPGPAVGRSAHPQESPAARRHRQWRTQRGVVSPKTAGRQRPLLPTHPQTRAARHSARSAQATNPRAAPPKQRVCARAVSCVAPRPVHCCSAVRLQGSEAVGGASAACESDGLQGTGGGAATPRAAGWCRVCVWVPPPEF